MSDEQEQAYKTISLPLGQIEFDPELQARVKMDDEAIKEFADRMCEGDVFPPGDANFDGCKYWLWDGFTRYSAQQLAGLGLMKVNIWRGSREDAIWRAAGANQGPRAVRRTNSDKIKATRMALLHARSRTMSNEAVGEYVGVSDETVRKVRKDLERSQKIEPSAERTGRDGRTINTANIGCATRPVAAPTEQVEGRAVRTPLPTVGSGEEPQSWPDTVGEPAADEVPGPHRDAADAYYSGDGDDADPPKTLEEELADAQKDFDITIREMGVFKSKVRRIAEQNAAGPWLDGDRLDSFDRHLTNTQNVLKACRPSAICGYCQGLAPCDKCRGTKFLPPALAEAAPQPN